MEAIKVINSRYHVLSLIKKGGFGTIYKGHDSVLGKDIAVKKINHNLLEEAWYIDQFQNEARHVAKMNHQNIVHIFDLVKTEDSEFYIIMEFIDGIDLARLLQEYRMRGEPLPAEIAVHVVAEICKALDYAHNCCNAETNEPLNLVHQDVSPGNIMIARSGLVKLIDFGIAGVQKRQMENKNQLTLQGKLQYMSPEQVTVGGELDKRSDLFSLGLVLYEMLEGHKFFDGFDTAKIIETLRNGKLKLKDLKHTPKSVQKILQRALAKSPDDRYQNANQFYIDLVTHLVASEGSEHQDTNLGALVGTMLEPEQPQPTEAETETPSDEYHPPPEGNSFIDEVDQFEKDPSSIESSAQTDDKESFKTDELELVSDFSFTEPSESDSETPERAVEPVQAIPEPVGEDDVKTVIDVVRLATRGHKHLIMRTFFSVVGIALAFIILDFIFKWTAFGKSAYDWVFPPAVRIVSVPAGARVHLNDEAIAGTTPLDIDKIDPGVYEMKLTLDNYLPITKSLLIPATGQVEVAGENAQPGDKAYLFRFKTSIDITSNPPDAEVYINGTKYGQDTPCTVTWEVGDICEIELRKGGFGKLTGFSLDTERMTESIDDRRQWQYEMQRSPTIAYSVEGVFGKHITINSNPAQATIYLAGTPVGKTGQSNPIYLSAAPHKLQLRKRGYNRRNINLTVNEETPNTLFYTLTRPVRFAAYDASNGKDKDLGAALVRLTKDGRTIVRNRRTPLTLNLQSSEYEALFAKEGFRETRVKIKPDERRVTVRMEPVNGYFSVVVLSEETGEPIRNVEVRYKSLDEPTADEYSAYTDAEGTCGGNLAPGLYLFRTRGNDYTYQERSVVIQANDLNLIEFNLAKL